MKYEPKKRFLLYGAPKCGKTKSLATIPKGSSLYLVDVDRQAGSLVDEWRKRKHNEKDLEICTINTKLDPTADGYEDDLLEELRAALWSPPKGYDFYAVDSYTTVGLLLTHDIIGVGERDYNMKANVELVSYVTDFFWQFAGAAERQGAWLIVVMHEKWTEVKDGMTDPKSMKMSDKKEVLAPEVASSARVTIPAQCDFVFHVEKGRKVVGRQSTSISQFRTRGTPLITASTVGFDGKLAELEDADIEHVIKKLGLKVLKNKHRRLKLRPNKR
jgi:hypothetical protein